MTSQVLNFLWLNLELPPPPDPDKKTIRAPLPAQYIANAREAGMLHPAAEIKLWVDSRRLTERQMTYLKQTLEDGMSNVRLRDLRDIPAYDHEPLYNKGETNPHWRDGGQQALIWRQVDAAKVLVSLQGNFDQTFFADLDHAHLDIDSKQVQSMLKKHGLMIGSYASSKKVHIENQLWGFDRSRHKFFEQYYKTSLKCAYKGKNAWFALVIKMHKDVLRPPGFVLSRKRMPLKAVCLPISGDGSQAEQPGSKFSSGYGVKNQTPILFMSAALPLLLTKTPVLPRTKRC